MIEIDELIYHETLDPDLINIPDYVGSLAVKKKRKKEANEKITPLQLADASDADSREALAIVGSLRSQVTDFSGALVSELDDAATWCYLGLYFADKLRAGVALETYRKMGDETQKQEAIRLLEKCAAHWEQVVDLTKDRYMPTPHVSTQRWGAEYTDFSWEQLTPQVIRDIEIARSSTLNK